jgi:ribose transport system permease protein
MPQLLPKAYRSQNLAAAMPFALPLILLGLLTLVVPGFLNVTSFKSLLLLTSLLGIAAVGQTLAILIGGIDLSIPAVIGLADVLFALLYGAGWPAAAAIAVVLVISVAIGLATGLLIRVLDMSPLVVTLATSSILIGAIWAGTHGEVVGAVPSWLTGFVSVIGTTGPIPMPSVVTTWLVLAATVFFIQQRTVLGRWIYAAGSNSRAASLAGVPLLGVWMTVFGLSAGLAAITGILLAGFSGAADPTIGQTYLFTTIAAVVVGGTSLIGGRGGYLRTISGCLVITELTTLFVGLGLDQAAQQICLGILIVVLVSLYARESPVSLRI